MKICPEATCFKAEVTCAFPGCAGRVGGWDKTMNRAKEVWRQSLCDPLQKGERGRGSHSRRFAADLRVRVWIWGSRGRGVDWRLAYLLPWPEGTAGSQEPRSVSMPLVGHGTVSPPSFALKISVPFNPQPPGLHRVSPIAKILGIFLEFLPDDFPNRPNGICK